MQSAVSTAVCCGGKTIPRQICSSRLFIPQISTPFDDIREKQREGKGGSYEDAAGLAFVAPLEVRPWAPAILRAKSDHLARGVQRGCSMQRKYFIN